MDEPTNPHAPAPETVDQTQKSIPPEAAASNGQVFTAPDNSQVTKEPEDTGESHLETLPQPKPAQKHVTHTKHPVHPKPVVHHKPSKAKKR